MNWGSIFRRPDAPSSEVYSFPAATPLQQQRIKQIESLSLFNKNVIEKERDKEYCVKFITGQKTFSLKITLPSQFPNEKPIVQLSPEARHPWLNEQMYVTGCGALNCFYMHSNLGRVVKQITEELQANISTIDPSSIINSDDETANSKTSCDDELVTEFLKSKSVENSTPTALLICTDSIEGDAEKDTRKVLSECKNIEEFVAAARNMPLEDIEKLSADSEKLLEYVNNMDIVKDLQNQQRALQDSNLRQAEYNLTFKPIIEDSNSNLDEMLREIEVLESEFSAKSSKQDELFQMFDLNQIIMNLKIAVSQAEESSEAIADRFLEGNMTTDDFLKQFLDQRQLMHLRKAKEERIRYFNPEY